jgi:hypothetical protein
MLNFNDNKDISTIETQIIKNEKQINSALLELFNNQYKAPKSLKGDKDSIDFNDLEKEINNSLKIKNSLIISQKTRKKTGIHLNKNNILFNQNIILYNKNINLNRSINSSNEEENNISAIDKPEKKLILQKRFDKGNIALNSNQITNVKDINNPYIYSYVDWHPYSFCTGHRKWGYENGKLKSPSPTFISNDEWCEPKDLSKSEVLKGILIKDDVGLLLVDPLVCNKFSGMLGDLIKQILKVFFGHKISLNVKLFQPLSLSQTLLNYFSFIPKFILPAVNPSLTPLDRMKLVISLGISGLYMNAQQLKPFNPLISETFQGIFDVKEKIEVYSEQTSNYPTLTRYYILNKNFKMYGYFDLSLETKNFGNRITCFTKGLNTLDFFKSNEKIFFSIPSSQIVNAIAKDDRSAHYVGVMIFFDIKNKLRAFVQFAKDCNHIADIKGYIFKYEFEPDYKFNFDKEYEMFYKIDTNNLNKNNNIFKSNDIVSTISGSWLGQLYFDNNKYWDIDEDIPTYIKPVYNCLPSDSRFREDLIWLYRSFYKAKNEEERLYYEKLAQNWKLMIEKVQREERTLKAKVNEELAKKMKNK